jgi:phosphoglycerol transferase
VLFSLASIAGPTSRDRDPGNWSPRRLAVETTLVASLAAVLTAWVFQVWQIPLRVPLYYQRDAISAGALVQRVIEGSYNRSDRVGFPSGLEHRDFPLGPDNLNLLILEILGRGSQDWALVLNAFFLLGFPLTCAAAYAVLRRLHLAVTSSAVASLLFAFLPYHFLRGEGHIFLAAYYPVPLACFLLLRLFDDVPPLFTRIEPRVQIRPSRSWIAPVLIAIVLGSTGSYYAIFFIVLAIAGGAAATLARRTIRPLLSATGLVGVTVATLVVNLSPTLWFRHRAGANAQVVARSVAESDFYALRLIQMIVPIPGHRIPSMNDITAKALAAPNNSEAMQFLGLVGAAGFLYLLAAAIIRLADGNRKIDRLIDGASTYVVIACLIGTTGGLSWVLGLAGFTEIRAWNRLSVFIGFLSLMTIARVFDRFSDRALARAPLPGSVARVAIGMAIVVLGVLDQTSPSIVPDSRRFADEYRQDRTFVAAIEARLEPGTAVLQWPFLPFPEAELDKRGDMVDYDPFRGYLHSSTLRWSYGAMRGRGGDWQRPLEALPIAEAVPRIIAIGFRGISIDRLGYSDRGAEVEAALQAVVGPAAVESHNQRYVFYDLRPTARSLTEQLGLDALRSLRAEALDAPPAEAG